VRVRFSRFAGVKVGVGNFFLGQSIGIDKNNTFQLKFSVGVTVLGGLWALTSIDENNTFQLKFLPSMKTVGVTGLDGLWALNKNCGRHRFSRFVVYLNSIQ